MNSVNPYCFLLCVLVFSLTIKKSQAQPFTRDTSFELYTDFNVGGSFKTIRGTVVHPDGRLLVHGDFKTSHNHDNIARFYANGQVDFSFPATNAFGAVIRHVEAKPYGYFMIHEIMQLQKLNHSGVKIDTAFSYTCIYDKLGTFSSHPFHLPDGRYLIGAAAQYPAQNPNRYLTFLRLLPTGHVDTTFTHSVDSPYLMKLLAYGPDKILLGGKFEVYDDSISTPYTCRIDLEGNLDTTFQSIFTEGTVMPHLVQPDGKIIVTGLFRI